jgi:hypothetical protein
MATFFIDSIYSNSDKYTIMDPVTSLTSSFIDVSAKETELTAGVESALHAKCSEGSSYAPYASSNQQDELAWSSSTLLDQLDPWSKGFLSLGAMVYTHHSLCMKLALRLWICSLVAIFVGSAIIYMISNKRWSVGRGITGTCLVVQEIGILVGHYYNSGRLLSKCKVIEVKGFAGIQATVTWLVIAMILISTISLIAMANQLELIELAFGVICEVVICLLAGANAVFILADANTTWHLLHLLTQSVDDCSELNMHQVNIVRNEVRAIESRGLVGRNAILATALLNVLGVFVLAVTVEAPGAYLAESSFVFGREIVIAVVLLYYAALTNEKYDTLVDKVAAQIQKKCCPPVDRDGALWANLVLNSIFSSPITFPLVGMTLRRKDVLLRLAVWIFGVALSLLSKRF